jgi:hypothetical protein
VKISKRIGALAFCAAVAGVALSCGSDKADVISEEPPATTPTPSLPQALEPIGSAVCAVGKGSASAACHASSATARYVSDVNTAIDAVVKAEPGIFNKSDEVPPGSGQYRVLNHDAYVAGVLYELRAAGFCADRDYTTLALIQVKNSSDLSENYEIYKAPGYIHRGTEAYQKTCTPADFPVDPDPNGPPPGSGCGRPYPPPINKFSMSTVLRSGGVWTLDATPIVGPDHLYCAAMGYTDGRSVCQVRPVGTTEFDDRQACELWRAGVATDTHKAGPTWTHDGGYCGGPDVGCQHNDNPFQIEVDAGGGGVYEVCTDSDVCNHMTVDH